MYTLRFIFEDSRQEDIEFVQNYTEDELRKLYNQSEKFYIKYNKSKVTRIEIYRFEELIFEYPTGNVIGLFDTIKILYNQIKRDEEYCKSLYQQMTDYFIHGQMYQGDQICICFHFEDKQKIKVAQRYTKKEGCYERNVVSEFDFSWNYEFYAKGT